MAAVNFNILAARLLEDSKQYKLVEYIYSAHGTEWQHINYRDAGNALGVDKNTIKRYVDELARKNILQLKNFELRLNADICVK